MAITTIKSVDGSAWLTSGAVSSANLGLTITGGDGYANGAGTFNAWDSSDPKTTKPHWSDSASYVIWSNSFASTGAFEFCSYTGAAATALAGGADGVEIAMGVQFRLTSFTEGTTPAHNSTRFLAQILDFGGTSDYPFRIDCATRNAEGFAPGVYLGFYGQTSATAVKADVQGGGNSSYPMCHFAYDRWYHLRIRYKPSATSSSNDGELYIWVNDVLLLKSTNIDGGLTTASRAAAFLSAFYSFGSSITGLSLCTCGPVWAKTYPSSDHASTNVMTRPWTINTTQSFDLRRNYHAYFSGTGSHWTTSGAISVPATGTRISTSGVYPGVAYFPLTGTAGQGATLDTPSIWGGNSADTPFGADGVTHITWNGLMAGTASAITGTLYAADNTTELFNFQVDAGSNLFYVNGVSTGYAVKDDHWYRVTAQLTSGSVSFVVNEVTKDTIEAGIAFSTSTTCAYTAGSAIGKARIVATEGSTEEMRVMGITVAARHTVCVGDSYSSSNANAASPEYHCNAQRMGLYWNASADGTIPAGYDPVAYAGGISGLNIATNFARSGSKLSEFMTHIKPALADMKPSRLLVMAYDVNDIPASVLTNAAAWTEAETIAQRKVDFCRWAAGAGHTVIITDGFNLRDAGSLFNGTSNYWRRKIPLMVQAILPQMIREAGFPRGRVTYLPSHAFVDGNADSISTDGVHGTTTYERQAVRAIHDAKAATGSLPGFNTDGSIERNPPSNVVSMIDRSN